MSSVFNAGKGKWEQNRLTRTAPGSGGGVHRIQKGEKR